MAIISRLSPNFPAITLRREDFGTQREYDAAVNFGRQIQQILTQVALFLNSYPPSGTTAQRPTGLQQGAMYYDATLKKPIWVEPSAVSGWVDATGASV